GPIVDFIDFYKNCIEKFQRKRSSDNDKIKKLENQINKISDTENEFQNMVNQMYN
ncbi:11669_t:CDS:1, partial [Diversispora eburnea]